MRGFQGWVWGNTAARCGGGGASGVGRDLPGVPLLPTRPHSSVKWWARAGVATRLSSAAPYKRAGMGGITPWARLFVRGGMGKDGCGTPLCSSVRPNLPYATGWVALATWLVLWMERGRTNIPDKDTNSGHLWGCLCSPRPILARVLPYSWRCLEVPRAPARGRGRRHG